MDEIKSPKLRRIEQGVERRIRELRDSGEPSGLAGEGAPFPPDPDSGAADAWAARHLARTSGARPEWADLRRDIAEHRARIVARLRAHLAWLDRRARLLEDVPAERIVSEAAATRRMDERIRAEVSGAIDEMNVHIRRHNLLVTAVSFHLPTAAIDDLIEIARRPRA